MMNMKLAIAMTLQRYKLRLIPGARIDRFLPRFVLSAKEGVPMSVYPRQDADGKPNPVRGNIREMVELP
jgi:hypothetical protein